MSAVLISEHLNYLLSPLPLITVKTRLCVTPTHGLGDSVKACQYTASCQFTSGFILTIRVKTKTAEIYTPPCITVS